MEKFTSSSANQIDLYAIKKLLKENELPFKDIDDHISHFKILKVADIIIGSVGLEVYGKYALLRSLAVNEKYRNIGIGRDLYNQVESYAKELNVKTLYLLTTSAEAYFRRKGFSLYDRNTVPEVIMSTQEFKSLCPSHAVCMFKNLF
jgi:amino-acid N-acetyltransferase